MVVEEKEGGGINPQRMVTPGGVVVHYDLQPEEEGAVGGWPEDFRMEEATQRIFVSAATQCTLGMEMAGLLPRDDAGIRRRHLVFRVQPRGASLELPPLLPPNARWKRQRRRGKGGVALGAPRHRRRISTRQRWRRPRARRRVERFRRFVIHQSWTCAARCRVITHHLRPLRLLLHRRRSQGERRGWRR